jgi:hypothetical protein
MIATLHAVRAFREPRVAEKGGEGNFSGSGNERGAEAGFVD